MSFYVYLIKQILHNEKGFEDVEIHAIGDNNIMTAARVVDMLTRFNYVTMSRLKTKSITRATDRTIKLIFHLKRTSEFERLYLAFQAEKERRFNERSQKKDGEGKDVPPKSARSNDSGNSKKSAKSEKSNKSKKSDKVGHSSPKDLKHD